MIHTTPIEAASQSELTREMSSRLHTALTTHLRQAYAPDDKKHLRAFSATEIADLLGVTGQFLRKCHSDGTITEPKIVKNGRRFYSAEELLSIRHILEDGSRRSGKYIPGRRGDDKLQIIQLMNFKGGSAKSTSAIHLCHYLALNGYRVLGIDLDPQGSMTTFCGIQPELEFEGASIYDALRYDDPLPMEDAIVETYFPNLHLAPAKLVLSEFETETAVHAGRGIAFFERLSTAIDSIEENYDVVIIDSPPALGFLTLTGLYAATSVLVPMTPSMLDLASTQQFVEMTSAYLQVIEDTGAKLEHDFFSFLITRDDPADIPSQQITSLMRALFQDRVISATGVRSTGIADAAMLKMSIYEVVRSEMTRSTYDRARASMDAVGGEISQLIQTAWVDNMAMGKNKTGIMAAITAAAESAKPAPENRGRAHPTLPKGTIGSLRAGLGGIQEIDTTHIIPWGPQDRLEPELTAVNSENHSVSNSDIAESISQSGQQVPVLLRPSQEQDGFFEVVYGRRRILACKQLGIPVKALIRTLDDKDALMAKGLENASRTNLSFYERARFASAIIAQGYERATACQALSVSKNTLSQLERITRLIPDVVGDAIGPAPDSGRPKWMVLATYFEDGGGNETQCLKILDDLPAGTESDERLSTLIKGLAVPVVNKTSSAALTRTPVEGVQIKSGRSSLSFSVKRNGINAEFAEWLDKKLDGLLEESFRQFQTAKEKPDA